MIQILKYHETILIFYAEYKNILDHLLIKKNLIEKYQYYKALDYIRIELKNVLISDIKQRILFKYGSQEDIINQISQELKDPIWNDIQQIQNFPNILHSPIVQAIVDKDVNVIYKICKNKTKKYYLHWMLKKIISRILSFI